VTVAFGILFIFSPVPILNDLQNKVQDQVLIKQQQSDRWGLIPGKFGYQFTKTL